ncbi:MAG: hypothetical protein K5694_01810 [Bacilli bacterium]|nr:hypothetical protein [Bacilli bacterium]
MKTKLPLLVLSTLILASCGGGTTPAASSSSEASKESETSTVSSIESSAESSEESKVESSEESKVESSEEESFITSGHTGEWASEQAETFEAYFGEGNIDYIPAPFEDAVFLTDYYGDYACLCVEVEFDTADEALDQVAAYKEILAANGWYDTVASDDGTEELFQGVYNGNEDLFVAQIYTIENTFTIDFYQHIYIEPASIRTEWDASESQALNNYFGSTIAANIPCWMPEGADFADYTEDYGCFSVYYENGGTKTLIDYANYLTDLGFVYSAEYEIFATDIGEAQLQIMAYITNYGEFEYDFYVVGGEQQTSSEYSSWDPTPIDTGAIDVELTGDQIITPTEFAGATGYDVTSLTINGVTWNINNVMKNKKNGSDVIQIRKENGTISNATALAPLDSLSISINSGTSGNVTFKIYAGTSADALNEVSGINGVYALNGATFVKLSNEGSNACYLNGFALTFEK